MIVELPTNGKGGIVTHSIGEPAAIAVGITQGHHRTQTIEVIVVDGVTIGHVDHTHRLAGYLVGFKKILPIQQKNTEKRLISIVELVLSQPELFAN